MNHFSALKQAATNEGKPCNFAIFNPTNMIYFSKFVAANALLITDSGECILYVSSVNYEQAKAETRGLSVQLLKRGENVLQKIAKEINSKNLAVDSLSVENWRTLAKEVGGEENLWSANRLIMELRSVKTPDEIRCIREACKIANIGMQKAKEIIGVGLKERDVAAEVEYAMRKAGSDGTAFETIVASGPTSAFPHGSNLERKIGEDDFVIVDLGATYRHYRSDITRTFIASKATLKQAKIYNNVKLAQQKAVEAIKPKIEAKKVDAIAREIIDSAGFGEYFVHNLGHGVGLDVHEAPTLSPETKDILAIGNVITVEPGIYLPGFGGVRIEDTVLVTKNGAENLTSGICMP